MIVAEVFLQFIEMLVVLGVIAAEISRARSWLHFSFGLRPIQSKGLSFSVSLDHLSWSFHRCLFDCECISLQFRKWLGLALRALLVSVWD